MNINRKQYIGAEFEHLNVQGIIALTQGKDNEPIEIDLKKISYIEYSEIYWRKENAIHKWFVDNCQGGQDDCGMYPVERDQFVELRDLCQKVIINPEKADELLPSESGFFFGGTEYDEWYFNGLKDTVKEIDRVLEKYTITSANGVKYLKDEFFYQSSW